MVQNEKTYRDLLINEIIDIYEKTRELLGFPNKQKIITRIPIGNGRNKYHMTTAGRNRVNREDFSDVPRSKLEHFCKILKEVLDDYKCGFDLVHKGSLFHYFIVYYKSNEEVNFNSLKYLMDLTLAVNDSSNGTFLNLTENLETLLYCLYCLDYAEDIIAESKIQKYLMIGDKNGNTVLHKWAKKGNFFFCLNFLNTSDNSLKTSTL